MTAQDEFDIELPARLFAASWLSVAVAGSEDPERPALFRSVAIELHSQSVLLVATDSYMLMRTWVPLHQAVDLATKPDLDDAPASTVVALDADKRMNALMRFIFKDAKDDPFATVRLRVERGDDPAIPSLTPEMERVHLVVEAGQETLRLSTWEGEWVSWRTVSVGTPGHVSRVALSPDLLARCGKVVLTEGAPMVIFDFCGATGPTQFAYVGCAPEIEGVVMPARIP